MSQPNNLVYVDTEFTNLDPRLGDLLEVAWAVNDGPVQSAAVTHTLQHADPEALRINRYYERELWRLHKPEHPGPEFKEDPAGLAHFLQDLTGATLVAENYGIDWIKLLNKIGFEPWHYRKIELSSVAMTVFALDRPEGLSRTAARLRDRGYPIPTPDHTAEADVECLRACYKALCELRMLGLAPVPAAPATV